MIVYCMNFVLSVYFPNINFMLVYVIDCLHRVSIKYIQFANYVAGAVSVTSIVSVAEKIWSNDNFDV